MYANTFFIYLCCQVTKKVLSHCEVSLCILYLFNLFYSFFFILFVVSLCLHNASLTPTNWQRIPLVKTCIYVFDMVTWTMWFMYEIRQDGDEEGIIKCLAHKMCPDCLLLQVFHVFFFF